METVTQYNDLVELMKPESTELYSMSHFLWIFVTVAEWALRTNAAPFSYQHKMISVDAA